MIELTEDAPYECDNEYRVYSLELVDGEYCLRYRDEDDSRQRSRYTFGDLFDGLEFLEDVESGYIIDYDGCLHCVIVDGRTTNIGIDARGVAQGDFMLDANAFRKLCEDCDVKVIWCGR